MCVSLHVKEGSTYPLSHGLDFLGPFHFCLKGDYQIPKQMFAVQFVAQ